MWFKRKKVDVQPEVRTKKTEVREHSGRTLQRDLNQIRTTTNVLMLSALMLVLAQ